MLVQTEGDDEHVMYHRACALSSYLLYLVDESIFVEKSVYYMNVVYLCYFTELERIHEYN